MKNKLINEDIIILSPSEWSDILISNMHISSNVVI